jgi:hypothetical protein
MSGAPVTKKLPCKLSDAERALKSSELSREVLNNQRLLLERSLTAQRISKDLKASSRVIGDLAEEVRTGIELREVPVYEKRDYTARRVLTIRGDTNELVTARPMEPSEKQAGLFDPNPVGPGDDDDDSDDDDDDADVKSSH